MVELVKDKRETENLNKYYRVGMKMDENTNDCFSQQSIINTY